MVLVFLALIVGAVLADTEETDKEKYPDFADLLGWYDYDFEAHEVKTEDGWYLTLFHILRKD